MRRSWRLIETWKAKRQGQVWIVANDDDSRGYFKFARKDQWYFSGPMIANELISAELAKMAGLSAAPLELASVQGPDGKVQKGLVSLQKSAAEIMTWHDAENNVRRHPEKYVNRLDLLSTLVVFDAWIMNIDRAKGKNLILFRSGPDEKYDWYLIDHGLALYGSPRKWKKGELASPYWEHLWNYYHVPRGLLRFQSTPERLEPMLRKIESLKESDIDHAIGQAPREWLNVRQRLFIRRLLLYRQKRLRSIIHQWLKFRGPREYGGK